MHFDPPLITGTLIQRYKRFLADVKLDDGQTLTAHCPNPGAMLGSRDPGMRVALSLSGDKKRKLPYTLEMVHDGQTWIGVNTMRANQLVAEALAAGRIPALAGYTHLQPEVRYGERSRIDFLLSQPADPALPPQAYVEVKSVTLRLGEDCAFPDCVTERGRKHLSELATMAARGQRAVMLFVIQRSDGVCFRPAHELDPAYAEALAKARAAGVEILAWRSRLDPTGWELAEAMPWKLS